MKVPLTMDEGVCDGRLLACLLYVLVKVRKAYWATNGSTESSRQSVLLRADRGLRTPVDSHVDSYPGFPSHKWSAPTPISKPPASLSSHFGTKGGHGLETSRAKHYFDHEEQLRGFASFPHT